MKQIIGVCHLLPLPGSPGFSGNLDEIVSRAVSDAKSLEKGGIDTAIVENFGDRPFTTGPVEPHVVAAMTMIAAEIRAATRLRLGINVLRNDAKSALAIASAVNAEFVRVNVFAGTYSSAEGVLEGNPYAVTRYRAQIAPRVKIYADVFVKHAVPFAKHDVGQFVEDMCKRCGADALIVTGKATGKEADIETLQEVKAAAGAVPVLVGSGINSANAREFLKYADGAIVGTAFKKGGKTENPVDAKLVRAFLKAI